MELNRILKKIDDLKKHLDGLGPLNDAAKARLLEKIRLEWNYHSNVIEGNTLTFGETKSLLLHGLTAKGKPLKDHLDIKGHNEALKKLDQIAGKEVKITENVIKEFHKIILIDPFEDHPEIDLGKYKRKSNYLYNEKGERVDFVHPDNVASELNELINWTNNAIFIPKRAKKKYETHPLLIAATFHSRFINIHPFDDGNGRICRIMMNLILIQCGYPPIVIKQEERKEYFRSIEKAREEGVEILAEFLGKGLVRSLELYIRAAEGKSVEEPGDLEKELTLLKEQLKKEEDVRFEKSNKTIIFLWRNCFHELFTKLQSKLEQFDELFFEKKVTCSLKGDGVSTNGSIVVVDHALIKLDELDDPNRSISHIEFRIRWKTFKKNARNPFDVDVWVGINFNPMEYLVVPDGEGQQSERERHKKYNEILLESEINEIVDHIGRLVLTRIKRAMNIS